MSSARARLTKARRAVWRRIITDGYSPSYFAKAIVGMTLDDWKERAKHNDWTHVARQMDRWFDLYEIRQEIGKVRTIGGVVVPIDYAWDKNDAALFERGARFNPFTRLWVDRGQDGFDEIQKYNEVG